MTVRRLSLSPLQRLARNVASARASAGLTQAVLASRARLSRATVTQIEAADADPRLSTILALADALGCDPVELLGTPCSEQEPRP